MKRVLTILFMMTTTATMAQNGKATTQKETFSRTTSVSTDIKANPAIIWELLTRAADYPRWNSTVISIDGTIAIGHMLKLKSTLAPKRTFKLKVKEMEDRQLLKWGDALGNRVFTLASNGSSSTIFTMTEKIGGFMFPLYSKHIPSFDQSFTQFAADLKKEAETIQTLKK